MGVLPGVEGETPTETAEQSEGNFIGVYGEGKEEVTTGGHVEEDVAGIKDANRVGRREAPRKDGFFDVRKGGLPENFKMIVLEKEAEASWMSEIEKEILGKPSWVEGGWKDRGTSRRMGAEREGGAGGERRRMA